MEETRAAAIAGACKLIVESPQSPSLDSLAKFTGLSRWHFHRLFKSLTGLTPKAYALAHRTQRVRTELRRDTSITSAIYNAGYNSNGHFYAHSREALGMTPATFKAGGEGAHIRYAITKCSLGLVLVAASDLGVCMIALGDNRVELIHDLRKRFSRAVLVHGDHKFKRLVAQVVAKVERPAEGLKLPLHVQGTAFQHRVWRALCDIRAGTTRTYSQIAAQLGSPRASRAVARACAANAIAVAIPCHRVVRSTGSPGGYRWGVGRKRQLLRSEMPREAARK